MPQAPPTAPRSRNISASCASPRLMCTETPSAPCRMASSTVATSTFQWKSGPNWVLPERCRKIPGSGPGQALQIAQHALMQDQRIGAAAMPIAMACSILSSPGIGPQLSPWSSGRMTIGRHELQ